MKNLLLILNPNAGMKKANKYLTDILVLFKSYGYESTVCVTTDGNDAFKYVQKYYNDSELIVCIGGDGTFNQVVEAVIELKCNKPIGYIPAGSTNDFANSLKLSKKILEAAEDIMTGMIVNIDIGKFNDRYFSYVASCGLFTKASYATPQNVKNMYGHLAYVLEGIKDLTAIKSEHLKFEFDGKVYEDDYVFAAVCNSTSVGGVLTLKPDAVDLNDGLFEILLIKMPKNIMDLNAIIVALNTQEYNTEMITFHSVSSAKIYADKNTNWTIDGEFMRGCDIIDMQGINNAIKIVVPNR